MIYRFKKRDLSTDVTKHTTKKHKIIVYSVLAVLVVALLIFAFLK